MPTFIDEFGDTGHEPDSASPFRLAAVFVPTQDAVEASRTEQRWLEGLYLDVPEEWDDPYRIFRW